MARDLVYKDGYLPLFGGAEVVRRSGGLGQFAGGGLAPYLPPVVPPTNETYFWDKYNGVAGFLDTHTPDVTQPGFAYGGTAATMALGGGYTRSTVPFGGMTLPSVKIGPGGNNPLTHEIQLGGGAASGLATYSVYSHATSQGWGQGGGAPLFTAYFDTGTHNAHFSFWDTRLGGLTSYDSLWLTDEPIGIRFERNEEGWFGQANMYINGIMVSRVMAPLLDPNTGVDASWAFDTANGPWLYDYLWKFDEPT